jgi:hypothetical protein
VPFDPLNGLSSAFDGGFKHYRSANLKFCNIPAPFCCKEAEMYGAAVKTAEGF